MSNKENNVENVENSEMMVVNRNDIAATPIDELTNSVNSFYSSIQNDGTRKSQVKIYNAINNAKEKLDNHKGETLKIKDVVAHAVEILDEQTGELVKCTRIVLIDDEGIGYESISLGVYFSLQNIFGIVGLPTWEEPLELKCIEQRTRKGFKTLTIELV